MLFWFLKFEFEIWFPHAKQFWKVDNLDKIYSSFIISYAFLLINWLPFSDALWDWKRQIAAVFIPFSITQCIKKW